MVDFENDIKNCFDTLNSGGIILYPTDTIWGIGCDATNEKAVERIFALKKRSDKKSMIILVADEKGIHDYVEYPDKKIFDYLSATEKQTTVIYDHAKNVAHNLISSDGTIAIRIIKDDFCKQLLTQYKKPIVSTSANISEEPYPTSFKDISDIIKNGADYIVQHRQDDFIFTQPSSIIKINTEGKIVILRS